MVRLFRTEHRVDTDVDISSVAFWSQTFRPPRCGFRPTARRAAGELAPSAGNARLPEEQAPRSGLLGGDHCGGHRVRESSSRAVQLRARAGQPPPRPVPGRPEHAGPGPTGPRQPPASGQRRLHPQGRRPAGADDRAAIQTDRGPGRRAGSSSTSYAHVAAQLPLRTIADLFGLPPSEHDSFVVAADAYVGSGFPAELPAGITMQQFYESPGRVPDQPVHERSPATAGECPAEDLVTCSGERGDRRPPPQR